MAYSVLLQSGLRPLSAGHLPRQTSRLPSNAGPFFLPVPLPGSTQRGRLGRPVRLGGDWTLRMSAPMKVAVAGAVEGEDEKKRRLRGGDVSNGRDGEGEFDPGAPPPFGLAEIREAIPKHCWEKDPWRSAGYVVRDVAVVLGLAAAAAHLNSWAVWPLYWLAQGIMFFALFMIGHDCGHGSFSNNEKLNSVVGHFLHSSVLVPYHGWRISHRTHHQNQGHIEKDEGWHPLPESIYKSLDSLYRLLSYSLPFAMLIFPLYLFVRTPGRKGSHFHPGSDLFQPNERRDALTSTACWTAMVGLLAGLTWLMGPMQMLKLYFMPYLIFVMWLDLVTYLHHHGHEEQRPWYRGKEWSYLRGGLSTLDRDYGWINNIHHDIGTHVIHHLFPQIPHYHVVEATEAARPVLGKYYKEPEKSGPLPLHLFRDLARCMERNHFVSDTGDVVYYQKDSELNRSGTSGRNVEE